MVNGGNDVEFEFSITCGLEHSCVDLDLLDSRAVQFLQRRDDSGFLART